MSLVLQGRVVEKWSNRPVAGATVTINGYITSSDASGNFRLNVGAANYTVRVVHKDYLPVAQALTVRASGTVQIVIEPIFKALR